MVLEGHLGDVRLRPLAQRPIRAPGVAVEQGRERAVTDVRIPLGLPLRGPGLSGGERVPCIVDLLLRHDDPLHLLTMDLLDEMTQEEPAELRWHLELGTEPNILRIVTTFPVVVEADRESL
ncbi:hypothetical protein [Streptomyces sp. MA5143a]|uniref:hypothetical protein n=1 Tax=Streptomyces sp. MA5143a TaxID=2083010 RepID=UPI0015E74BFF|nr:hypothetical protein [Streptomyces sp. MA5143a]